MRLPALLLACALVAAASLRAAPPPNVVLINADDLGFGDLACYAHPVIRTPNLDQLARDGLRFTQFYAPSALCSPSRAALLTGRTPYRSGIKSWIPDRSGIYLHKSEVTLAALLRRAGYATALIGKWHLNSDLGDPAQPQPADHGFDYAYGHNAFQTPTNRNPDNVYRNGQKLPPQPGYTAQLYADEAIRWLEQRATAKAPFFLYLAPAEPHTSIENPPEFNARYAGFTRGPVVPIPNGGPKPPEELLVARGPGEYYANITYLDTQLGRVLDALDRLGLRGNTLVIFTSDNGPVTSAWQTWYEINAHGETNGLRGRKGHLYEGGIRVPAIVRFPGQVPAGAVTAEPATAMDLFTTLAHACGVEVPTDRPIDGIDISEVIRGQPSRHPARTFYWALPNATGKEFAYREGDWKLLLDSALRPIELFDLKRDPLELINRLAAEPARVADLTAKFKAHHAAVLADPLRPRDMNQSNH
jgi:arylsulfatase A-like enzyme